MDEKHDAPAPASEPAGASSSSSRLPACVTEDDIQKYASIAETMIVSAVLTAGLMDNPNQGGHLYILARGLTLGIMKVSPGEAPWRPGHGDELEAVCQAVGDELGRRFKASQDQGELTAAVAQATQKPGAA